LSSSYSERQYSNYTGTVKWIVQKDNHPVQKDNIIHFTVKNHVNKSEYNKI
jgi:hypothetical protein